MTDKEILAPRVGSLWRNKTSGSYFIVVDAYIVSEEEMRKLNQIRKYPLLWLSTLGTGIHGDRPNTIEGYLSWSDLHAEYEEIIP